jgi:hypothetical protein
MALDDVPPSARVDEAASATAGRATGATLGDAREQPVDATGPKFKGVKRGVEVLEPEDGEGEAEGKKRKVEGQEDVISVD